LKQFEKLSKIIKFIVKPENNARIEIFRLCFEDLLCVWVYVSGYIASISYDIIAFQAFVLSVISIITFIWGRRDIMYPNFNFI